VQDLRVWRHSTILLDKLSLFHLQPNTVVFLHNTNHNAIPGLGELIVLKPAITLSTYSVQRRTGGREQHLLDKPLLYSPLGVFAPVPVPGPSVAPVVRAPPEARPVSVLFWRALLSPTIKLRLAASSSIVAFVPSNARIVYRRVASQVLEYGGKSRTGRGCSGFPPTCLLMYY
jgi:hypothetical protein